MKTKNYYAYPAHKTGYALKAVDSLECSTLLETIRTVYKTHEEIED